MGTIYDYLSWRGDLTFSEAPLNEVDCMIFSMISYLDYQGIVPASHDEAGITLRGAAAKVISRYPDPKKMKLGVLIPKTIGTLFRKLKDTKRFRNVELKAFVNRIDQEREMQFSALTYLLDNGTAVVTYRGTDDTLVGWKEDMNMSYLPEIPSQTEAVEYLRRAAVAHSGALVCTGHSKGGNLAVWAAVKSEKSIRRRIKAVYSNEGPGFQRSFLEDAVYLEMRPLIRNLVPQSSVVGMLLEHDDHYTVVKSRQTGLLQHNGLTWEVMGHSFVHLKKVSGESRRADRTINQWIHDMTHEQRMEFTTAVYQLFSVEGVTTLTDLIAVRKKWLSHSKHLDPKVHETIQKMLTDLIKLNSKNLISDFFHKGEAADKS
ncbi:MAG: DUF2974 domain-containing protein [Clostridia bacterium]|nr:DUF2974 domain-containing protein [Clostridia bacterium]